MGKMTFNSSLDATDDLPAPEKIIRPVFEVVDQIETISRPVYQAQDVIVKIERPVVQYVDVITQVEQPSFSISEKRQVVEKPVFEVVEVAQTVTVERPSPVRIANSPWLIGWSLITTAVALADILQRFVR